MRKLIIILSVVIAISSLSMKAHAKTTYRYTTQTVSLKEYKGSNAPTVTKVKRNTKLTVIKSGKTWTYVRYKRMPMWVKTKYLASRRSPKKYTAKQFRFSGVLTWGGKSWTWYSQRVLPGRGLKIPGRHVDSNGFVCDKDNYIVVASTPAMKRKHTIVPTPFGKFGKCYDCGAGGGNWRDVYVAW